jgi:hypothetical protein
MQVSVHRIVKIQLERCRNDDVCWLGLELFDATGKVVGDITLFGKDGKFPEIVDITPPEEEE